MNASRLWICLAAILGTTTAARAQDRAMLADHEWTVAKSEEAPPGTRIHFASDGKLTVVFQLATGKAREVTGTYALSGNQLTLKLAQEGRERIETRTIKKLTDAVLITEDKNHKVEELHRGR
jgi:uncharacterized protein (TIGR03066 family)